MAELAQFEAALKEVEPAARLVPERHLRKLLHYLRDHGRVLPRNPDRPLWVSREDLAAADMIPRTIYSGTEDPLLLLTTPEDRSVDSLPRPEQLREYWQLLFESALIARLGRLHEKTCEARLAKLGPAAIREVRYVLEAEHAADPDADDVAVYRSFAASYLALDAFAPNSVADFFPSLPPRDEVLALIGQDLDRQSLLARSRPRDAAEARPAVHTTPHVTQVKVEARAAESLKDRAREVEAKGNFVRAAILLAQAGDPAADAALDKLIRALASVLNWDEARTEQWRNALATLVPPAATGDWPRAARCLYELQKITVDLKNEVFAVDLVEPIRTLGRRPIKRPLPHARDVMLLLKLRAAQGQLHHGKLESHELHELFAAEMHHLEETIRANSTPIIVNALAASGLVPANRVESVARDKLVAELLDRVCERGQLRFGDLRDAVARNQLKMPDLRGPGELLSGDPLLLADTRLAYDLDGIYCRGEFYLRALQRGSSLFFGTRSGRWLFLYLIAPFLAAFLTLTFAIEIEHLGGKIQRFAAKILAPKKGPTAAEIAAATGEAIFYEWDEDDRLVWIDLDELTWSKDGHLEWTDHEPEDDWDEDGNLTWFDPDDALDLGRKVFTASEVHESPFPEWEYVFVLGVFLLLMFHAPPFRRAFFSVVVGLFATSQSIVWNIPKKLLQSRIVVAIRYSALARFFVRYLIAPMLFAAMVVLMLWFLGAATNRMLRWGGIVLGIAFVAFNTPWGWSVQERLAESISDGWRIVRVNLLPGLVATILEWFRRLANWVERQLYAVDEWLRFRSGDSSGSLVRKAIIGLVWFPFAYFARFAFNLLIEPQFNPVKHFPVVTVSHKVILPLTGSLANLLNVSPVIAFWLLAGVPGIFGFIAWELLSNWKLYAANRPAKLRPAVIGSHGESMRGLLRPGFHSGTVPKLFRKLRRADIRHDRHKAAHLHHELHHAAEGVERFVERELIAMLKQSPEWGGRSVALSHVMFGCQRVAIELMADGKPVSIAFENRDGRIAVDARNVSDATAVAALAGLFDMAAAERQDDRDRTPMSWAEWTERWG